MRGKLNDNTRGFNLRNKNISSKFMRYVCFVYSSYITNIIMKRKNGGKMQSEQSNFFRASAILRSIFYISTFTVLLTMFLLQNETNLDVVAIRNYVDVLNTSSPLHKISVKSFSVSCNTSKSFDYFAYFS